MKISPSRHWHLASLRGQSPYQLILGQLERWPSLQVVQNTYILQWASQSFIGPSNTQVCKHNYHNRRVITIMSGGFHHFQIDGAPEPEPERHLINEMFQCFWDCHAPGLHCNDLFYGHNLSHHLRERHGIHGPDNARVFCQWRSCDMEVNKESLTRHIEEKHMKVVHPCVCGKLFSRGDTLNKHRREKQH
ncbi:hypothetical protein BDR06DRAFT_397548 [Suillus hirtellus]|nr:hypothetical protein BDR06DRAFT_397548 [Suillus hirtellus]